MCGFDLLLEAVYYVTPDFGVLILRVFLVDGLLQLRYLLEVLILDVLSGPDSMTSTVCYDIG